MFCPIGQRTTVFSDHVVWGQPICGFLNGMIGIMDLGGSRYLWRTKNYRQPFDRGNQLIVMSEDFTKISDNFIERQEVDDKAIYSMRHPALEQKGKQLNIYCQRYARAN